MYSLTATLLARTLSLLAHTFLRKSVRDLHAELDRLSQRLDPLTARPVLARFARILVIAEDHRFLRHEGLDPVAVLRAVIHCLFFRSLQGGSTLEQQLVRTVTGRYERTLRRKVREILLATTVRDVVPKALIPAVYLSVAYFGWRMHGIHAASRRLGFSPRAASERCAIALVARLKYPEPRYPSHQHAKHLRRRIRHIRTLAVRKEQGTHEFSRFHGLSVPYSAVPALRRAV